MEAHPGSRAKNGYPVPCCSETCGSVEGPAAPRASARWPIRWAVPSAASRPRHAPTAVQKATRPASVLAKERHAITISPPDIALRLLSAVVLGALIGLERERLERAAGLRTHTLVALGAALVTIVSAFGFTDAITSSRTVVLDPSRIAAQVVSGIGFLGAGVIILRRRTIRGLTTAASVWATAAVGLACGGALYWAAGLSTALLLFVQLALRPLEQRLFARRSPVTLSIRCDERSESILAVERLLREAGIPLRSFRLRRPTEGGEQQLDVTLAATGDPHQSLLVHHLLALTGVRDIAAEWGDEPSGQRRVPSRAPASTLPDDEGADGQDREG